MVWWSSPVFDKLLGARSHQDKYTLSHLRSLYEQLSKTSVVSERNQASVVESLRTVAELIIWGEQHDPSFFELFLEKNFLSVFWRILRQARKTPRVPPPPHVPLSPRTPQPSPLLPVAYPHTHTHSPSLLSLSLTHTHTPTPLAYSLSHTHTQPCPSSCRRRRPWVSRCSCCRRSLSSSRTLTRGLPSSTCSRTTTSTS